VATVVLLVRFCRLYDHHKMTKIIHFVADGQEDKLLDEKTQGPAEPAGFRPETGPGLISLLPSLTRMPTVFS
jgi:hypothetical protein